MRVADVMETEVDVLDIRTPAEDAWDLMKRRQLRLLVAADGDRIVGVVDRARLGGHNGLARRHHRTLVDFLRHDPLVLCADYPVGRAVDLLADDVAGCVPVVDKGRLVGVLSVGGLLKRLHDTASARQRA
jgi:CBS domain-containing protein